MRSFCPVSFRSLPLLSMAFLFSVPIELQAQPKPNEPFKVEVETVGQGPKKDSLNLVTVFHLKHTQAAQAARMVLDLQGGSGVRIVADERTNSIFVQGTKEQTDQVADLLKVIDAAVPKEKGAPVEKVNEIKIFSLKHIIASETAMVILELMDNKVRVSSEEKTNSLTVIGTKEQLDIIEAVLIKLDEGPQQNVEVLRIYPLRNNWNDAATQILSGMSRSMNFAIDEDGHRLLVRGNKKAHDSVAELIEAIDIPKETASAKRLQLRIVWLVDSKLASADAPDPSANLDRIVKVLNDKLGMTNMKMAAQILVSLDPQENSKNNSNEFFSTGTAKLDGEQIGDITVQGTVTDQKGPHPVIRLETTVRERVTGNQFNRGSSSRGTNLASLMTIVSTPPGHSIVLGVTPIESSNSVFILQVVPENEINAAPAVIKKSGQSGR